MKKPTTKKPAVKNRGPRRRAIVILFRSGKFEAPEIARLFGVKVSDVWSEIRKALA